MTRAEAGKLGYEKVKEKLQANAKAKSLKSINKYNDSPKYCKGCETKIPYEKRSNVFCNHSCSAKTNNKNKLINRCLHCNKLIHKPKLYCNNTCQHAYKWQIRLNEIEKLGLVPSKNPRMAKKYLKQKYGHNCSICSISEWQNKKLVMILDHINGNSEDWLLVNLRLLCPNCDSQTDTWKGKNKGNGRHARRQRYKEGKSY